MATLAIVVVYCDVRSPTDGNTIILIDNDADDGELIELLKCKPRAGNYQF